MKLTVEVRNRIGDRMVLENEDIKDIESARNKALTFIKRNGTKGTYLVLDEDELTLEHKELTFLEDEDNTVLRRTI